MCSLGRRLVVTNMFFGVRGLGGGTIPVLLVTVTLTLELIRVFTVARGSANFCGGDV